MIDFTDEGLQAYLDHDPGGPVVMLNLLRFRPDTGQQSYMNYVEAFDTSGIADSYGVEIVYAGTASSILVAGHGQTWDMVALIRYPSRQHFVDMVRDPRYSQFEHYRRDALTETVLQATIPLG